MPHHVTLVPGQKGTLKLQRQYGDSLLRVRYRYDPANKRRLTTVEIVVENVPWEPKRHHRPPDAEPAASPPAQTPRRGHVLDQRRGPGVKNKLAVKLLFREVELRREVRHRGGWWDPELKVWWLGKEHVEALDLTQRIVDPEVVKRDQQP